MLKKRIVLSLLFDGGVLVNSRRFELNKIAEVETMLQYLNFESIDELMLLNIDRTEKNVSKFLTTLEKISKNCFIPISVGGGISSIENVKLLFDNGADKVVINSIFYTRPQIIANIIQTYGSQSVVISLDLQNLGGQFFGVYDNGKVNSGRALEDLVLAANELGAGEILLRSYEYDGMASGYNLNLLREALKISKMPVIISGGVGNFEHLLDGLQNGAQAVSVGNLFHYVGEKLLDLRTYLHERELEIPTMWNY